MFFIMSKNLQYSYLCHKTDIFINFDDEKFKNYVCFKKKIIPGIIKHVLSKSYYF